MSRAFLTCLAIGLASCGLARAQNAAKTPLYYRDPSGKPVYSARPSKTPDGRDYTPVFEDQPPASQAAEPSAPAKRSPRILYYRNPMGLADRSVAPKKDSMGMDYLPVYADENTPNDPPGTVRIDPGRLQILGVRTALAQMRPGTARTIHATGILEFDERRLSTVTTKVPGWIEQLDVAAMGDPVRRGQTLAQLYAPDLVASEDEFLIASRMGGAMQAAAIERLRALDIPPDEIRRLRQTGHAARRIAVMSAETGVVIDKPVQAGMHVDAGQALYRIADLSDIWLIADIQEQDIGAITTGQSARAGVIAFPGRVFDGRVDLIYPSLSAQTRTARVRIVLPNGDGALRAAMFATVQLDGAAHAEPVLAVPNSAIIDSGTSQVVLVDRGAGRFEPHAVQLGARGDAWVQIRGGIKPGDSVVVGANFLIDSESNLRAALQGFAGGPAERGAAP